MTDETVDFDAPDLAARIERLSQHDLDQLPFGVVRLDRDGVVQFYSATEARLSDFGNSPLGRNFFAVSNCANRKDFQARIVAAQEAGAVDLDIAFPAKPGSGIRGLRIRVQSARQGGVWLFIERD